MNRHIRKIKITVNNCGQLNKILPSLAKRNGKRQIKSLNNRLN
jgi:hypothetical protein